MSTTNKNFKVKNGLNVAGEATFESSLILGTVPLAYDTETGRLRIQIDGTWTPIAFKSDIPEISFMDIALTIDYDGQPVYTVQANGVTVSGDSKYADGGTPSSDTYDFIFDSGAL